MPLRLGVTNKQNKNLIIAKNDVIKFKQKNHLFNQKFGTEDKTDIKNKLNGNERLKTFLTKYFDFR